MKKAEVIRWFVSLIKKDMSYINEPEREKEKLLNEIEKEIKREANKKKLWVIKKQ